MTINGGIQLVYRNFICQVFSAYSVHILNRIGEVQQPCRSPLFTANSSASLLPIFCIIIIQLLTNSFVYVLGPPPIS